MSKIKEIFGALLGLVLLALVILWIAAVSIDLWAWGVEWIKDPSFGTGGSSYSSQRDQWDDGGYGSPH